MGYRSGLAAGAATLLLATAGWPHFVVAQDGKQFEPLKAGSGRFEIIAGGSATPPPRTRAITAPDAVKPVAMTPAPRPLHQAASLQTAPAQPACQPALPKADTPKAEPPQAALPKAALPQSDPPKAKPQQAALPQPKLPKAEPSQADVPQSDMGQVEPPQAHVPPSDSAKAEPPQAALSQSDLPHSDLPVAPAPTAPEPAPAATPVQAPERSAALLPPDPVITNAVPPQPPLPRASTPMIDESARVASNGSVLMVEALRRARSSLETFLQAAAAPPEGTSGFAVKVLVGPPDAREALWLSGLERRVQRNFLFGETERWSGQLANTPAESSRLRIGDRIAFETSEIRDWTYVDAAKRTMGNFTACALTAPAGRAKLAELTEKTGLDCGWVSLVTRTAGR